MDDDGWSQLRQLARDAAGNAYAPYSGLHVGAAGRTEDGRVVTGCNVENVSYGLTLCAECGLVGDLHRSGGGRLTEVVATDSDGRVLAPCGRCRQLLMEAGGPDLEIEMPGGRFRLADLLPGAFTPEDLPGAPGR